jgi:hypothetical protein
MNKRKFDKAGAIVILFIAVAVVIAFVATVRSTP